MSPPASRGSQHTVGKLLSLISASVVSSLVLFHSGFMAPRRASTSRELFKGFDLVLKEQHGLGPRALDPCPGITRPWSLFKFK